MHLLIYKHYYIKSTLFLMDNDFAFQHLSICVFSSTYQCFQMASLLIHKYYIINSAPRYISQFTSTIVLSDGQSAQS